METNLNEQKDFRPHGIAGLGGWLILLQIGIYGTLIVQLLQLPDLSSTIFDPETWSALTSSESEFYHPSWGFIIIFESVYNVAIIGLCIYILINFYLKKSIVPRLLIILYVSVPIVGLIDYLFLLQIPLVKEMGTDNSIRDIIRSMFTCAIWTAYLLKSERVRNTFIN